MKTTIEIIGVPELVLQRAVSAGIARSKTDAIRIAVLALNQLYGLVRSSEGDLVVRKILKVEAEELKKGRKPQSTQDVLAKYPHLKKIASET